MKLDHAAARNFEWRKLLKIAVIGAGGNAGKRAVAEVVARGHHVTAIGPEEKLPKGYHISEVKGDLRNQQEIRNALSGHPIVVSAVRFLQHTPEQLVDAARASAAAMQTLRA
jgi:putative NADH-flavin reductase